MEIEKKDYRLLQKIAEDEYLLIHPETNAENVLLDINGIEAKTAAGALTELTEKIKEKADVKDIPDVSNFITNAVSDLLNYYSKSDIDNTVSDLENKISAIPKFKISVVDTLPTEDISDTTIYLVKTSTTESGNLFTEYIYVNNDWEKLGTQSLNLSGYATEDYVNVKVKDFVTEDKVKDLISKKKKSATTAEAESAGKLSTPRELSLSGDATGSTTFDGSKDEVIEVELAKTGVAAGTYSAVLVDEKGRVLAGAQVIEVGAKGQTTPSANLVVGGLFFEEI